MLIDGPGPGSDRQPAAAEEQRMWSREEEQPVAILIHCHHLALKLYPKPVDKMNIGFLPYFVNYIPKYVYGFKIPWHQ